MAAIDIEEPFPLVSLLPKKETQALSFIARQPTYDGRGIKIAILDSGVDPGAPGLSVTTDGKPKVIHVVDASGASDVDTSTVVSKQNNHIIGITGRKLVIPESWPVARDSKYHVGAKNGYEFYPKDLRQRISKDHVTRNIKQNWDNLQAMTHATTQRFKDTYNTNNISVSSTNETPGAASADVKGNVENVEPEKSKVHSNSLKLDAENNQAKLDVMELADPNGRFCDVGPTYDVVCFQDTNTPANWRVCVDTSERGDLAQCQLLSPYSESYKYGTLTNLDRLNYAVNVHDDGNLVELATMSSAHGTHVASIAAAHFPDEPDRNGVAPGAQIISICIGDARVAGMETGTSLVRGLSYAVKFGADIINMSYGEHSNWTGGRVMEVLEEVVNKHGIVYMSSAGNRGPALSTIGTPPTTSTCTVVGIGAWVSPDMMAAEYSMRERLPSTYYTWTSRGPTMHGALGVSVCAPGGAITSVPSWCLRQTQLMNGTSMSSPNAAGCVALLLSGMKQRQLSYSPFSVKRALENSALKPSTNYDVFAMGAGLLQVEKAFELLSSNAMTEALERDVRFQISVIQQNPSGNNGNGSPKNGIYLRQNQPLASVHIVTVTPVYLNEQARDTQQKIDFDLSLTLVCDASFVTIPTYLSMSYMSRAFSVRVNPAGLPHGVHYASIRAYDARNSADKRHYLFEVPITVIAPLRLVDNYAYKIDFPEAMLKSDQTQVQRYFIDVPRCATSAIFEIHNCESNESINAVLHTVQLIPGVSHCKNEFHEFFALAHNSSAQRCIPVVGMYTLEIVYGKMWSSLGQTQVKASVQFFSLSPLNARQLHFHHSKPITTVDVASSLQREECAASITLKQLALPLKPVEAKIRVLSGQRDEIFGVAPTYQLLLTYALNVVHKGEISIDCPLMTDLLYESEYESQLWMLFDANKQLLKTGDVHPHRYHVELDKADYTLKLQVRHPKHAMVKKLEDMPITVMTKVGGSSGLSLDIFPSYPDAVALDGKRVKSRVIEPCSSRPLYVTNLADKQLKGINVPIGSYFVGQASFSNHALRSRSETFPVVYFIDGNTAKSSPPKSDDAGGDNSPSKSAKNDSSTSPSDQEQADKKAQEMRKNYNDALLEFHLSWLAKTDGDVANNIMETVSSLSDANEDTKIQRLVAQLNSLTFEGKLASKQEKIFALFDQIVDFIKPEQLLSALTAASKTTSAAPASNGDSQVTAITKELDKKKSVLVEAMIKKGLTLCDMIDACPSSSPNSPAVPVSPPSPVSPTSMEAVHSSSDAPAAAVEQQGDKQQQQQSQAQVSRQYLCNQLDDLYFELSKWIDMKDSKVAKLFERHAIIRGHYARAIRSICKQKLTLEQYQKLKDLYKSMGPEWSYVADQLDRSIHVRYPKSYRLF